MNMEKYDKVLDTLSTKHVIEQLKISDEDFSDIVCEGKFGELQKRIEFDFLEEDKKKKYHIFAYIHDNEFCIVASKSKFNVPILNLIKKKIGKLKLVITDINPSEKSPFQELIQANIIDWRYI